jgi:tetratricopeptide (TPR) repeat protein
MRSGSKAGEIGKAMTIGQAFTETITLMNAGRHNEAQKICNDILKVRPDSFDAHNILGGIAFKTRKPNEAVAHFARVVELKPDHHEARLNLAKILFDLERWEDAERHYALLADTVDKNADVLTRCARVQLKLHKYDEAIRTYQKALDIHPSTDVVQTAIAEVYLKAGKIKDAEDAYTSVLLRSPEFAPALINLAVVRDIQGHMDDVLELQENVIRTQPDHADAHYHHAQALLTRERFTEGWAEYTWRFRQPQTSTLHDKFDAPFWNGEPLQDKQLLIWTEQGPGDEILISSMIPDALALGARCTLVCSERLAPLFRRSFPDIDIVGREKILSGGESAVDATFQASLSHLGLQLRQDIDAFPVKNEYLKADSELAQELRVRYQAGTATPLVGISWRSANVLAGPEKSSALAAWANVLRVPNLRFVSLQYGNHQKEIADVKAATGTDIVVDSTIDPLIDMDRFAAQVAAMDLIISVSNTTVHVAGAQGRTVWTLVPSSVGRIWYWFLERTNSPWYSSMRLFRQGRNSGWGGTLDDVAQALSRWR